MNARDLKIDTLSIDKTEEKSYTLPAGVKYIEFKTRTGSKTRMAVVDGETEDSSNYITISATSTWYNQADVVFPEGFKFYFKIDSSDSNNTDTVEILHIRK